MIAKRPPQALSWQRGAMTGPEPVRHSKPPRRQARRPHHGGAAACGRL